MSIRTSPGAVLVVALVVCSSAGWSQETQVPVKRITYRAVASVNGKDLYNEYCVHCHGDDGTGHGPDATLLRVPPGDLTTLACRNAGKFNRIAVEDSINRWTQVPRTFKDMSDRQNALQEGKSVETAPVMPVFGPIFAKLYPDEIRDRKIRMMNLIGYLKSLQRKSCAGQ